MPFFGPMRREVLEYRHEIPSFPTIEKWISREPTLVNVSPNTICSGCVAFNDTDIWLCMEVLDLGQEVDVHWIHWDRNTIKSEHQQQTFMKGSGNLWSCAM